MENPETTNGRYHWRSMFGPGMPRLGLAFAGMLFIGIGLLLFANGSLLMLGFGGLITGFIILFLCVVLLQRLSAPNPVIVIDEEGILDKRLLRHPVPWSALSSAPARLSGDPTVFLQLRQNRLHLARRRRGLLRLPYIGIASDEVPLVLSPVAADPQEVLQSVQEGRLRDLDPRVTVLQEALHGLSHEGTGGQAIERFVESARDALFLCPLTEGVRDYEILYATDDAGRTHLDLFSDQVSLETTYPDGFCTGLFLADEIPNLIERGIDEIRFDPGSERAFVLGKERFAELLSLL